MTCRSSITFLVLVVFPYLAFGQALTSKTVTIQRDNISVAEALTQLANQSGIELADKRSMSGKAKLNLNHKKASFWQIADNIARQAQCRISLYQPGAAIALVDGKPSPVAPAHLGIFRGTVQCVDLKKDFATGSHLCRVSIQFAWEPWFRPYYLELKDYQAAFAGQKQAEKGQGKGRLSVHGRRFVVVDDVLLNGPNRAATVISSLKGTLAVIGPKRMETVTFNDLNAAANGKTQARKIGVNATLALTRLRVLGKRFWQVRIELKYPEDGPEFDSNQDWLINNKTMLQYSKNKKLKLAPIHASGTILKRTSNYALIEYTFQGTKSLPLGKAADWHLLYTAPSHLVEITVPFEFKNVPLP